VFEQKVETDENGTASLTRLQEGYYEIRETSSPLGYVRTSGPDYFKVKDGVITRLSKVAEDDEATDENETLVVNWPENADTTGMFQFSAAKSAVKDDPDTDEDESEPAQSANYVIGNEPGVALPSTGGPGTTMFYILGLLLTGLAGAGLVLRKRRAA
jgi:LPXTG-motif cell wall-anchored protein